MKKLHLKSMLTKMILYIGLLVIVVCLGFYFIATSLTNSALTESMDESLSKIAQQAAQTISERISIYFGKMKMLAMNDLLLNVNTTNRQLILVYLKKIQASEGYLDLMIAGKDGIVYTAAGITTSIADREYYKQSMAGNDYASDPIFRLTDNRLIMVFSVPIKDAHGNILGVLALAADGYELCDLIADVSYAKTGNAFVLNGQGTTIAHRNHDLVLAMDNDFENVKTDKGLAELVALETKMVNGESGVGEYKYNGVSKYMGYSPIAGTSWSIAITAPRSEVFAAADEQTRTMAIVSGLLVLLGIGIAIIITRGFQKPILQLAKVTDKIASGNLDVTVDIRREDEIGTLAHSLKVVTDNMNDILLSIRTASEQVNDGAKQISDSGVMLAQGATEQASAIEQLTSSMEEIASQTKLNADNANEANMLASEAKSVAQIGNDKMHDMLKAMDDIDESSSSISRIIKVIDDIAFQTNILALNAAVEAARAGQHGKGFAVVAEEVRNLAARSANAAKETTGLIEGSSKKVNIGAKIARETADSLKKIVEEVTKVAQLINGISVASGEQSSGIEQINQGIMQVSKVVQANSATSQQSAAAARQLTAQAETLNKQVDGFTLRKKTDFVNPAELNAHEEIKWENHQTLDEMKQNNSEMLKSAPLVRNGTISLSDDEFGKY